MDQTKIWNFFFGSWLHSSLRAWFAKGRHGFSGRSVASNQRLHICLIRKRPMCLSNGAANPNFDSLPRRSLSTFNRGFVQTFRAKKQLVFVQMTGVAKKGPGLKDQHASPRALRVKHLSAASLSLLTARHLKSRPDLLLIVAAVSGDGGVFLSVANTRIAVYKATKSTADRDY